MGVVRTPRSGAAQTSTPAQVVYSGAGIAVPSTFLGATFTAPYIGFGTGLGTTVTANASTDVLTIGGNNGRLKVAQYAEFTTTGTLPAGLQASPVKYTITDKGGNANPLLWTTFKLTLNGSPVDITGSGSGTHTVRLSIDDLGMPWAVSRTLDGSHGSWALMHTADGVFDWTRSDEHVLYHYARGRKTLFTFNQTPTWLARNSALDAYGYAGGGQAPTDNTKARAFLDLYLARYNAVSAVNPTGAEMIYGVEVWNEPSHQPTGTTSQNWCGTTAELAAFTRAIFHSWTYPGVLRLGPGYTSGGSMQSQVGTPNHLYAYLVASDGSGGQAKDHLDGACYHQYDLARSGLVSLYSAVISRLRAQLVAAGLASDFPLYQTERGVDDLNDPKAHARCAIIAAANGVKLDITYTADSYNMNPRDYASCRAALEMAYAAVNGKTITYCAIRQDGAVEVTANGVTYVV